MFWKSATLLTVLVLATVVGVGGCDRNRDDGTREERSARPVRDQATQPVDRSLPPARQELEKIECNAQTASAQCIANHFCLFPQGSCGEGMAMGACTEKPTACSEVNEPVCGCDGNTYGNECKAWLAGVSIKARSACTDRGDGSSD